MNEAKKHNSPPYSLYQTNLPSIQLSTDWNRTRWWKLITYTDVTPTTWLWQETLEEYRGGNKKRSIQRNWQHKTKQNKNTTQYVMDTTIHKQKAKCIQSFNVFFYCRTRMVHTRSINFTTSVGQKERWRHHLLIPSWTLLEP